MPKFFFHVDGAPADMTGTELANLVDAKCEAARFAGRLLCDAAGEFWHSSPIIMSVTDGGGLVLFMISMSGIDAPAIQCRVPLQA